MNNPPLIGFVLRTESPALARTIAQIFQPYTGAAWRLSRAGLSITTMGEPAPQPDLPPTSPTSAALIRPMGPAFPRISEGVSNYLIRVQLQLVILPYSGPTNPDAGNPCRHTDQRPVSSQMSVRFRHLALLATSALLAVVLSGCGTINEKLADGMGDYVPQWMGGLPADAPPRPGTAKYDEFMKERERKRLEPAQPANDAATQSPSSGLGAVH